jgi:hypothetical protein
MNVVSMFPLVAGVFASSDYLYQQDQLPRIFIHQLVLQRPSDFHLVRERYMLNFHEDCFR